MQLTGHITPESLMSLEAYTKWRKVHKPEVMAHRKLRSVQLGEHVNLQFESETTIRYQIQEIRIRSHTKSLINYWTRLNFFLKLLIVLYRNILKVFDDCYERCRTLVVFKLIYSMNSNHFWHYFRIASKISLHWTKVKYLVALDPSLTTYLCNWQCC